MKDFLTDHAWSLIGCREKKKIKSNCSDLTLLSTNTKLDEKNSDNKN